MQVRTKFLRLHARFVRFVYKYIHLKAFGDFTEIKTIDMYTTVRLRRVTVERIEKISMPGETFDAVFTRILDGFKAKKA